MRGLSGVVIELTRPGGEYGAGASSVQMALRDLNEGGGITGCKLVTDRRDSQSQGTVASTRRSPLTPNDRNGSRAACPVLRTAGLLCPQERPLVRLLQSHEFSAKVRLAVITSGAAVSPDRLLRKVHKVQVGLPQPPTTSRLAGDFLAPLREELGKVDVSTVSDTLQP
jgi:hypothetical protein